MTQQEIDALSKSLRSQGLTWSQTNFAVSLIRNAVTAGREECARECEDEADRIASARTVASLPGMIDSADELASKSTEAGFRWAARILRSNVK